MTLKNDRWITEQAQAGMITPFIPELVRRSPGNQPDGRPVLSYGLSSFGYDLRLSPKQFFLFRHIPGTVIDVKGFSDANLYPAPRHTDPERGLYFILPAHSYGLGVALERLELPRNITGICVGKSTYARAGIIVNTTPAEAGWQGHLTLEFSNSSSADCRIYAGEGICQMLFFEGEPCDTTYHDRAGKYQGQAETIVTPRV